jgi:phospholipid-binding lipoprotein MlaA
MPRAAAPYALLCLLAVAVLSGCATAKNPTDPLEPFNRGVYQFNETVDRYALKPAAKGYRAVVPPPVRGGVTNVFGNFRDVTTAVNHVLQLKIGTALSDVARVAVNSTVGILGVFDVASHVGLDKHDEDFGQTLGWWGVPSGPYLVLPIFGPSTVRDGVGLIGDYFTDPEFYLINESPYTWITFGVRVVNARANLLEAERIFNQAAIDRYAFLRDAYLQRRRNQIYDGNPPESDSGAGGKRKTLKQLEEELDAPDAPGAAPAKP